MNSVDLTNITEALRTGARALEPDLLLLGGPYFYWCRVKEKPFSNGDCSRMGIFFLVPSVSLAGGDIEVRASGLRLLASQNGHEFSQVPRGLQWTGIGSMFLKGDRLLIEYILNDGNELGFSTNDTVQIVEENGALIWRGSFDTVRPRGEGHEGTVDHVKWIYAQEYLQRIKDSFNLQVPDLDPLVRREMPAGAITEWGQRLYDNLPDGCKADRSDSCVLIDIVSGRALRVDSADGLIEGVMRMRDEYPGAIIYRAEISKEPEIRFGVRIAT